MDKYQLHECRIDTGFKGDKPGVVAYHCKYGHFVTNLTKNMFDTRIRKGLNPCAVCSRSDKSDKRFQTVKKALEKVDAKLISLANRKVVYVCKCGKECNSWEQNVLKENFIGCESCGNPFNNPKVQEKIKQTIFDTHGVTNQFQVESVKKKIKETCIARYGVANVMQNSVIYKLNKTSSLHNRKEYIFPSGKIIHVQGYEPRCIDILLEKYKEEEITVNPEDMPLFRYINPDKKVISRYYPDIYIITENIVIEVKSDYTYSKELEKNNAKFLQVIKDGYTLHLYVFNKKELLYTMIYTKDIITYLPANPAIIILEE
jgi:hypothetical protein